MKTTVDIANMINERRKKKNLPEIGHGWVYQNWVKLLSEEFPAFPRKNRKSKLGWDDIAANKIVNKLWKKHYRGTDPQVEKAATFYHKLVYG